MFPQSLARQGIWTVFSSPGLRKGRFLGLTLSSFSTSLSLEIPPIHAIRRGQLLKKEKKSKSCQSHPRNQSLICDVIDQTRFFGSQASPPLIPQELSQNEYEEIVDESLEALYTYFDEVLESSPAINGGDVSYSSGVLTIKLGKHGTYVINKQTPNRQIWLSSPTSGPKRYDYIDKTWIYRHDGVSLYALLNSEIPKILSLDDVDFDKHCNIHQNN